MLGYIAFTIIVNIFVTCSAISDDLPSYFPHCSINDPDISGCIVRATDQVREHMIKGVPELDIPPVDPLIISEITSEQGTGAVNYNLKLTNATIRGLGTYKFPEFHYDTKTHTLQGSADFTGLTVESDYEINGKILVAPVNGVGRVTIHADTGIGKLVIKAGLVNRKGEEYLSANDIKGTIILGKTQTKFDGSFGNNEQISRATSDLLAEHSEEIVKDFTPAVEKVIEALMFRIINGITQNIPYKKLFPPKL